MARGWLLGSLGAFLAAGLLTAPLALADHGHDHGNGNAQQQRTVRVKGVIQSFTLTGATSGTQTGPVDVGTLAVLTFNQGTVTVTLTASTRMELTAAVLVDKFVGDHANVLAIHSGSQLIARKIEVQTSAKASDHQVTRGTVVSVTPPSGVTPGSLVIRTNSGTVTAALTSGVVVLVGDKTLGSISDLTPGVKVQAVWKFQNGSFGVVLIRVVGHSQQKGDG